MTRFRLSHRAAADLDEIAAFTTARWGTAQTRRYLDALEARLIQLAYQPGMGRGREDLAPGLLSFRFERHVVFYRATAEGMTVVRILHARQDPAPNLDP